MKFEKKEIPAGLVREISTKFGCGPLAASILIRRGITSGEALLYFLETDKRHLKLPFELPGMEDAVERILQAREEGERVLVFGDRDVDGISATVLLCEALAGFEMDVSWRIPTGDEPYGLTVQAVEEFAAESGTLIVTVDCGITNAAEVERARELGIDVVITDHHNPPENLPEAAAIVNPKLKDANGKAAYSFTEISGCTVAWKLSCALNFALKSELYGHEVCLLNAYPANESVVIEALKTRNLAVIDRLVETVVPGVVKITETRLPEFLSGQQIFCWDLPQQKKTLSACFGKSVEINMLDIAPEIAREIPSIDVPGASGEGGVHSLLRLRERSKIARYADKPLSEIDTFYSLFVSFVQKRERHFSPETADALQLAALAAIADIMPLCGENRIIVRAGLEAMHKKPRHGIAELLSKQGLVNLPRLTAHDISWVITPVLNAAGRMGQPEKAVLLLLEPDPGVRDKLAAEIAAMNEERKKQGEKVWLESEPLAQNSLADYGGNLAVASGVNIPRGLTGIIAAKLVKRFNVPGIVISQQGEGGEASGSLRSARGVDVTEILSQCADLFIEHGGHTFAGGFSIAGKNIPALLERLSDIGRQLELEASEDALLVDAELPPAYLTPDIFKVVDMLSPYGKEHESPRFLTRALRVDDIIPLGKPTPTHVKLILNTGKNVWPALYWNGLDKVDVEFEKGGLVDVVYQVSRNWFNNQETPQMEILGIEKRNPPPTRQ